MGWGDTGFGSDLAGDGEGPTIGLPVQEQVYLAPPGFPYLGVSRCMFANLNIQDPFAGATLWLALGDLQ